MRIAGGQDGSQVSLKFNQPEFKIPSRNHGYQRTTRTDMASGN